MAVSKGIVLALDLGTPSCSRGPLAFDLGPQLAQGAPGSSKGASLTIDLGTCLALGANLLLIWGSIELQGLWYPGAPLTIALDKAAESESRPVLESVGVDRFDRSRSWSWRR